MPGDKSNVRPKSALSIDETLAHQVALRGSAVKDIHTMFAT